MSQLNNIEKNINFIWVSTQDWDDVWTRKQRFAQLFARAGHRVLYIEGQLHWPGYLRAKNLRYTNRAFRFLKKPRLAEPNLYIATPPLMLPGQMMSTKINKINKHLLINQIQKLANALNFYNPILWLYPPDSANLIGKFNESAVVFDCVDDWSHFKGLVSQKTVQNYMNALFSQSNLVFSTHENLHNQIRDLSKEAYLVPNGVEPEHFKKALSPETVIPADVIGFSKPIIGFIGSVQYWLDFELIYFLASKRPNWSFVFIGPVGARVDLSELMNLPNIYFLGKRRYDELPGYCKAFDVCINPFKLDELSKSVDPLKVYEYLATGKPIVTVNMPAMNRFGDVVQVAHDNDSFLRELDLAVNSGLDDKMIEARLLHAQTHSWKKRFEQINVALGSIIT